MNRSLVCVALVIVAFWLLPQKSWAHPRIFSHRKFEAAKSEARKQGKFLLADFTASWCGPCQRMDETTWVDPKVEEWVNKYAVAVQVDVDEQSSVAEKFNISAMPTVLVFNAMDQSTPFDRHTGYLSATELLTWLAAIEKGETALSAMEDKVAKASVQHGEAEVKARYDLAKEYLDAGDYDKAAKQYAWLWKFIPEYDPAMGGVRMSFMASDMTDAARRSQSAHKLFEGLRDEAESKDRSDWVVLNRVLGESDKTLQWFDAAKSNPAQSKEIDDAGHSLERLLIEKGRWDDVGRLIKNPILRLKRSYEAAQRVKEWDPNYNPFLKDAATVYCALLAAGRHDEATRVGNEAIHLDDTAQMRFTLLVYAFQSHQPRLEQLLWIVSYHPIKVALVIGAAVIAVLGALFVIDRRRQARKVAG